MYNSSTDVLAFHNSEVTLSQEERTAMRDRRNANRDRMKSRIKEDGDPAPDTFIKQGSYAMHTMVQDADNDYDIDDGVYFQQQSLKESDHSDMSPRRIKELVCEALKDDRFNRQPQIRVSCVRVFYYEGYHIDMPIYRITTSNKQYELAADSGWVVSRAADVEEWFDRENAKSPDSDNGRQFRRLVRCIKKFARSRKDWKDDIASGFTITKLVSECYVADNDREDNALHSTMRAIYNRLYMSLEVDHPVTPLAKLTKGPDDPGCKLLRDKLKEAISTLTALDNQQCSPKQAAAAWDKVFNTSFFSNRLISKASESSTGFSVGASTLKPATVSAGFTFPNHPVVPNKPAGFA